jgi:hypothetical protein
LQVVKSLLERTFEEEGQMPYVVALGALLLTAAVLILTWAFPKDPRRGRVDTHRRT